MNVLCHGIRIKRVSHSSGVDTNDISYIAQVNTKCFNGQGQVFGEYLDFRVLGHLLSIGRGPSCQLTVL